MIELKTPREIEEMKPAGRFVGGILKELKENTKVGTNRKILICAIIRIINNLLQFTAPLTQSEKPKRPHRPCAHVLSPLLH